MTISSSLNAGIAGLRANATRLATISDNIANSATYGYRRAQTSFHSMVVGSGASGQGSYSAGGVRTTTMRLVDQGGNLISTQNATDIALSGRGFLPVTSRLGASISDGTAPLMLTSTGSFRPDAQGFLRDDAGLTLLGWPANPDGTIPPLPRDSAVGLRPIRIDSSQQAFMATQSVRLGVNLPPLATSPDASGDSYPLSVLVYDALGLPQTLEIELTPQITPPDRSNTWRMSVTSAETSTLLADFSLVFDVSSANAGRLLSVDSLVPGGAAYDAATGTVRLLIGDLPIQLDIGRIGVPGPMVQAGTSFSPIGVEQDGFGAGNLVGLMVDPRGFLEAVYDQGFRRTLFQIPIVDVPNPNGLTAMSSQAFQLSRESGAFFLWNAGEGPVGEFVGFALQESATDVAAELTGLIQTQRAYSSNAKVIQTVDEMFQETTNLKR
ncbi:MAG: flagellar hook protein FlgE [Roseinatronobacter sp.]